MLDGNKPIKSETTRIILIIFSVIILVLTIIQFSKTGVKRVGPIDFNTSADTTSVKDELHQKIHIDKMERGDILMDSSTKNVYNNSMDTTSKLKQ